MKSWPTFHLPSLGNGHRLAGSLRARLYWPVIARGSRDHGCSTQVSSSVNTSPPARGPAASHDQETLPPGLKYTLSWPARRRWASRVPVTDPHRLPSLSSQQVFRGVLLCLVPIVRPSSPACQLLFSSCARHSSARKRPVRPRERHQCHQPPISRRRLQPDAVRACRAPRAAGPRSRGSASAVTATAGEQRHDRVGHPADDAGAHLRRVDERRDAPGGTDAQRHPEAARRRVHERTAAWAASTTARRSRCRTSARPTRRCAIRPAGRRGTAGGTTWPTRASSPRPPRVSPRPTCRG